MPELPEVETVRRTLEQLIQNDVILDVQVRYNPMIKTDLIAFKNKIKNQKINGIERKGKHLIFILDQDVLIIHLRMEGKFYLKEKGTFIDKHEHVIFYLEKLGELRYHDVRKFGTFHLYPKADYLNKEPLKHLAKEPRDLDYNEFKDILANKNTEIKGVLLDQRIISGLGNIYVDETLFRSHIHPTRKACELKDEEIKTILKQADFVLSYATELGGSTIRSYQSNLGIHGRFQNELLVHLRKGESCKVCGTMIKKIKVKGRGTYVCETCQQ